MEDNNKKLTNNIFKPDNKFSFCKQVKPHDKITSMNEKIKEVSQIFPYIDKSQIKEALEQTNFSIEKAIDLIFKKEIEDQENSNILTLNDTNSMNDKKILSEKEILEMKENVKHRQIYDYLMEEVKKAQSKEEIRDILIANLVETNNNKQGDHDIINEKVKELKNEILNKKTNKLKDLRKSCSVLFRNFLDNKTILKSNTEKKEKLKKLNCENNELRKEKEFLEMIVNKMNNE